MSEPPCDHPGDLVIDLFGTFLGKRSERMTIRWREPVASGDQPLPEDGQAQPRVLPLRGSESARRRDVPNRAARLVEQILELAEPPETTPDPVPLELGWQQRQVAFSRLRSVTISGRGITISSDLMEALVERGIHVSFLSAQGHPVASLHAPGLCATVQTRRAQLAAYNTHQGFELARAFVQGKLRNQRHNLLYFAKYLKTADAPRYQSLLKKTDGIRNLRRQVTALELDALRLARLRDQLMGFEGAGGRLYWEAVSILLSGKVEFSGRVTRGATDPVNSALNYGYGILYSQVFGAVANAGLEPFAGFLHVDRPGKPSLVLDLVEEFRAPVVDRPILAWLHQGGALDCDEHGLTTRVRRSIADRVLGRLGTSVPYSGKRYLLRMVIQMQARQVAKALREEHAYRPFASRW